VAGGWSKLCDDLNDLYCLPDIFRVTRRGMGWVGNVACMVEREEHTGISGGT
jgi:hypothetical protein